MQYGFFGVIGAGGNVSNLNLVNADIAASACTGGFVGCNYGTVRDCGFTGDVTGAGNTGGFMGSNLGAAENCQSAGSASGAGEVGGFAGRNQGNIANCQSLGNATGTGDYVGGFVGWSDIIELLAGSDPLDDTSEPGDADGDGIADFMDPDYLVSTVWNNQTIPEYHNTTVPEYHNSTVWNNQTIPEYHNTTVPEYHNSTVWNNGTAGTDAEMPAWALGAIMAAIALSVLAVVIALIRSGRKKPEEPAPKLEPKKPAE